MSAPVCLSSCSDVRMQSYVHTYELRHTGADTAALAMLVEPLLPRAGRKELDKQKILKGDVDTDLFAMSKT